MPAPRSDFAARAVALKVCPNASPNMPDGLIDRLPWITWQIITPVAERSAQDRLGSTFQVAYSAHHRTRDDAYLLASRLLDAVESSSGLGIEGAVIADASGPGDAVEVRSATQAADYAQFTLTCTFTVLSL